MSRVLPAVFVIAFAVSSEAAAQIISAIPPPGRPKEAHVMAGGTDWDFGYTRLESEQTIRRGVIVAADFGVKLRESITVGAGGWFNQLSSYTVDGRSSGSTAGPSDIVHTFSRSMYSVYGSFFYRDVGIQAGIVPVRVKQTTTVRATGGSVTDDDGGQTDATVFGVVRMAFTEEEDDMNLSFTAGLGVVRYGSRPQDAGIGTAPASPSSVAASTFLNIAWQFYKRVTLDLSSWWTAPDAAGGVTGLGNRGGFRSSGGLGYKF